MLPKEIKAMLNRRLLQLFASTLLEQHPCPSAVRTGRVRLQEFTSHTARAFRIPGRKSGPHAQVPGFRRQPPGGELTPILLERCERFNFLYSYNRGERLFRSSMLKFLLLFSVLSSDISCGGVKIEAAVSSLSSSSI